MKTEEGWEMMIRTLMKMMTTTMAMITWRRALHQAGDQPALHQTAAAHKYIYKYESRHSK